MTKEKAQELIHVMKRILTTGTYYLPAAGNMNSIPLQSIQSSKDRFKVYINRKSTIVPNKYTLQLFYPEEGLLRIDVNGRPHENPDGTKVSCPHIHFRIKDKGQWDQWAFELPAVFGNSEDCATTLKDFLQYCYTNNINEIIICEQKEINYDKGD